MQRKWLVRISFVLFLFSVGYLVGAGLSKTIRHVTQQMQTEKPATANDFQRRTG
jgi:hypothetical protein